MAGCGEIEGAVRFNSGLISSSRADFGYVVRKYAMAKESLLITALSISGRLTDRFA